MKKILLLGLMLLLVALTTSAFAQGTCQDKDVKVKVITKQVGGDCCMAVGEECCGMGQMGMGQAGMGGQGMGNCGGYFLCCATELGLTEDQIKGLKAIQTGVRKAAIRNQADLQIMGMELDELLSQATPDRAAIDAKMTGIGELRTRMEKDRVLSQLDARLLLSKDQLAKCKQGQCGCMGSTKWMEKGCDMEKGTCPSMGGKCSGDGKK